MMMPHRSSHNNDSTNVCNKPFAVKTSSAKGSVIDMGGVQNSGAVRAAAEVAGQYNPSVGQSFDQSRFVTIMRRIKTGYVKRQIPDFHIINKDYRLYY